MALVMIAELASLVLFVFNADRMSVMFVGAMCAVGTLNASVYGFPALLAKLGVFFAASLWLAVNHADSQGRDYPLIRVKYWLLLAVAPLVVLAAGLQLAYFLDLKADTITSCCSKLFAPEKPGLSGELTGLGERTALVAALRRPWRSAGGRCRRLALAAGPPHSMEPGARRSSSSQSPP